MASINDIIKREVNPFDQINLRPGNFWGEKQDSTSGVDSIHQEAITQIEAMLDLVAKDHRSRTVLLTGDAGSGKSYLLGRLKRTLNPKAFFAYIGPWADSNFIWRHTLRNTVDSLINAPEGQQESQLILWLKGLAAFRQLSMKDLLFNEDVWNFLRSDRQKFIKKLKDTYKQPGIYNSEQFFGVLYCLTNPELYPLACEWLRGDDLSEDSLKELKVNHCIDSEDAAKNILSNFGKISTETQPIILCFDNLDSIPKLLDGFYDIQPLFNINTIINNEYLKNFLVIISLVTHNWKNNVDRIQQSDKDRIDNKIQLKDITLDQAEAIWANRLHYLHSQANPRPSSAIFPLIRQALEASSPGGKTKPRETITLGRNLFQKYKETLTDTTRTKSEPKYQQTLTDTTWAKSELKYKETLTDTTQAKSGKIAEFQLICHDEYKKAQVKITKISLISAPELIQMLHESLAALQVSEIKPKLLNGVYTSYSLSYKKNDTKERVGIVWTEDASMASFCNVMKACQRIRNNNTCKNLYLIRAGDVGKPHLAGNQIYRQLFTGTNSRHIKPTLSSVHYLVAYHNLVNASLANELVVAGKNTSLKELEALVRESEFLNKCSLLQDLGFVRGNIVADPEDEVKGFILNLVKTQNFLGKNILVQSTLKNFAKVTQFQVEQLIQQLCQTKQIQIINPKDTSDKQLVCWVIKS